MKKRRKMIDIKDDALYNNNRGRENLSGCADTIII